MLDRILESAEVARPVRVKREKGGPIWQVEARYAETGVEKLLYISNFNDHPVSLRVEVASHAVEEVFELRNRVRVSGAHVIVPAGETLIFRLP